MISGLSLSVDAKLFATAAARVPIWAADPRISVPLTHFRGLHEHVQAVAWCPVDRDGPEGVYHVLAVSDARQRIACVHLGAPGRTRVVQTPFADGATGLAWSQDGAALWACGQDGSLFRLGETGPLEHVVREVLSAPMALVVDAEDRLYVGGYGGVVCRDPSGRAVLASASRPGSGTLFALALSPRGRVAAAWGDQGLVLFEPELARVVEVLPLPEVLAAAWSGAGRLAVGTSATVRIYEPDRSHPFAVLEGPTGAVRALSFLGETMVVAGSERDELFIWDLTSGARTALHRPYRGPDRESWGARAYELPAAAAVTIELPAAEPPLPDADEN
ncbi:MAG: hypothetical protein HY908_14985 [Myxococcales bacterium]|nr:hypothetical protein [Myxococcales bacterium]